MAKNSTVRALLLSLLMLLLCVTMFVGSTYAWFTELVASETNRIVAGNLEIDLLMDKQKNGNYESISGGNGDIFSEASGNGILWEPGKTEIVYLAVANKGTLDLKYNIHLEITDGQPQGLVGALEYAIIDGAKADTLSSASSWEDIKAIENVQLGEVKEGMFLASPNGIIKSGEDNDCFALAVHMKEKVENKYQNGFVNIDVTVQAAQLASELDSFGNDYDEKATFESGFYWISSIEETIESQNGIFEFANEDESFKISGNAVENVTFSVNPTTAASDFLAVNAAGKTVASYDIKVEGQLYASEVNIQIFVGKNLANVKLYHDGIEMTADNYSYDSESGYLSFRTTSFSVYTVAYSKSEIASKASVENMTPGQLAEIKEGTFFDLSNGLDASQINNIKPMTLDVGYVFTALENAQQASESKYKNWHADFVVSFNKDVKTGSAAIAGQYEAFLDKWLVFTAFDVITNDETDGIPKDTEFRLLEPFRYVNYYELCDFVKVFKCGAFKLDDSVIGTNMTVELRLYETKPIEESSNNSVNEETGVYETIGVYEYTFK